MLSSQKLSARWRSAAPAALHKWNLEVLAMEDLHLVLFHRACISLLKKLREKGKIEVVASHTR